MIEYLNYKKGDLIRSDDLADKINELIEVVNALETDPEEEEGESE